MKYLLLAILMFGHSSYAYEYFKNESDLINKYNFICNKKPLSGMDALDLFGGGYQEEKCYKKKKSLKEDFVFKVLSRKPGDKLQDKRCLNSFDSYYLDYEIKSEKGVEGTIKTHIKFKQEKRRVEKYPKGGRYPYWSLLRLIFIIKHENDCYHTELHQDSTEKEWFACFEDQLKEIKEWYPSFEVDHFRDTRTELIVGQEEIELKDKTSVNSPVGIWYSTSGVEVPCPKNLK